MKSMEQTNEIIGKIVEGFKIIKFLDSGKFSFLLLRREPICLQYLSPTWVSDLEKATA